MCLFCFVHLVEHRRIELQRSKQINLTYGLLMHKTDQQVTTQRVFMLHRFYLFAGTDGLEPPFFY